MKLTYFHSEYIPPPFGFINLGATCYFNALIQSLLTCTSLTEIFINNNNNPKFIENKVAVAYLNIIKLFYNNLDNELSCRKVPDKIITTKSAQLWKTMISYLKEKNLYVNFGHGQEDSYEAFIMLMRCWEEINEINILFEHTYHNNYVCMECKKHRFTYDEMNNKKYTLIKNKWKTDFLKFQSNENNISIFDNSKMTNESKNDGWVFYNTHFIAPAVFNNISNKIENRISNKIKNVLCESKNLQDFITCPKNIHEDLQCIYCKSKKDKIGYYTLAVISEILIIVIKKYKFDKQLSRRSKLNINTILPDKLTFENKDGNDMVYRPIAQIYHSGGLDSGHYWAHTIRCDTTDKKYKWYDLNDTSAQISNNQEFITSISTYTVIYHIISS